MNMYLKIFLSLLLVGVLSIATVGWLSYTKSRASLEQNAKEMLTALAATKKLQIESYFNQIINQSETFAQDFMIIQAMREFKTAFAETQQSASLMNLDQQKNSLFLFYQDQFIKTLNLRLNQKKSAEQFMPVNAGAILLQTAYLVNNPNATGKKDNLTSSPEAGKYDEVHKKYHPYLRNFLKKFKYYDIFLIDHITGNVLYTVFKEIDFANNLFHTELKESNLAQLVKQVSVSSASRIAKIIDYKFYDPSYAAPAAFVATPIYDQNEQIGVLAFQMPVDEINAYMTNENRWKDVGLGETGETFLVGDDFTMRSVSRFLIENKQGFIKILEALKVDPLTIENIQVFNTTILLQKINTPPARSAIAKETGVMITTDYRNIPVLSAYAPLAIPGLTWGIIAEKDIAEAFAPIHGLIQSIGLWSLLLLLGILLFTFLFAYYINAPINKMLTELKQRFSGFRQTTSELQNKTSSHDAKINADIGELHNELTEAQLTNERINLNLTTGTNTIKNLESAIAEITPLLNKQHELNIQSSSALDEQLEELKKVNLLLMQQLQNIQNKVIGQETIGTYTDELLEVANKQQSIQLELEYAAKELNSANVPQSDRRNIDQLHTLAKSISIAGQTIIAKAESLKEKNKEILQQDVTLQAKIQEPLVLIERITNALRKSAVDVHTIIEHSKINLEKIAATQKIATELTVESAQTDFEKLRTLIDKLGRTINNTTTVFSDETETTIKQLERLQQDLSDAVKQFKLSAE